MSLPGEIIVPAEPAEGKPTYEQLRAALLMASKALGYIGIDSWEQECYGDYIAKAHDIAQRAEENP